MNRAKRYHDVSLHPPTHPPPRRTSAGAGDALLPWVFLDNKAYIADNRNHTTAYSRTRDENEIQASFFLAEPPAVSHCCFSRTGSKDPTVFGQEPRIVAAEANLVLFLCIHGSPSNFCRRQMHDYYVYQAAGGVPPSLKLLPHPPPDVFPDNGAYYFHNRQAGLLRYSSTKRDDGGAGRFTLRRHGFSTYDQYIIAALCPEGYVLGKFLLCTYDSKTATWSSRLALLDVDERRRRQLPDAPEECGRVITIDEDVGTMGWVDLWKGIMVCDVLPCPLEKKKTPVPIRYMPLPPFTWRNKPPGGPASMYRDIAVVQGQIKFAEVWMHIRPVSYKPRSFVSDGWTAVTWSRTANSLEEEWHKEFVVHAHEVSVDNMSGFELLPELVDDKGTPQPTLERIHIGHPKLGHGDDEDIVYFTTKVHHGDPEAWVIAIDMRNKMLRGVAKFGGAPRILTLGDSYTPSCISGYLTTAAAAADNTKNLLKRHGMPLPAPSHKVVIQTPVMEYSGQMEQLGFHEEEEDGVDYGANDKGNDDDDKGNDDDDNDDDDDAMDFDWC